MDETKKDKINTPRNMVAKNKKLIIYPLKVTSTRFIVWGPGPDGTHGLTIDNIAQAYASTGAVPSIFPVNLTYDPTNGATRHGDVYRY